MKLNPKIVFIGIIIMVSSSVILNLVSSGSKNCKLDEDCISKSGCYHGCWKDVPKMPRLVCIGATGPNLCICYKNKCEDFRMVMMINATEEESVEICNKYPRTNGEGPCFGLLAQKTNNQEYCKMINYTSGRNYCFKSIAKEKLDLSICEMITDYKVLNECREDVQREIDSRIWGDAKDLLDVKECKKIVNEYLWGKCHEDIASKLKDENICYELKKMNITNKHVNFESCIDSVARLKLDKDICDNIKDKKIANNCKSRVELKKTSEE